MKNTSPLAMFDEMDKGSSGASVVEKSKPKSETKNQTEKPILKSKVIRNLPVYLEKKFNFIKGAELTDVDFSEYIRIAIAEKINRDLHTIETLKK